MEYVIGFIAGLLVAILIVATLTFFRRVIENRIEIVQKQVDIKGPRPKGYIIEPVSEAEDIREQVINKNKKRGLDTPLKDLL